MELINSESPDVRIACVSVPNFPLQLSKRDLPKDFNLPVVLIDRSDRSDSRSTIMAVDQPASKRGIHSGMAYVTAIAVCPELHAVCPHIMQINQVNQQLINHLTGFSPAVEPVPEYPGAYYLDIRGMHHLEPDLHAWGSRIQTMVYEREQLHASIVFGFTRFGVRAAAQSADSIIVFESMSSESQAVMSIPLAKLNLSTRPLKELEKLGVHTVGDLRQLPEWEVRSRFTEDLFDLIRKAKSDDATVRGVHIPKPYCVKKDLEYVESDAERIVDIIQEICRPVLGTMERHSEGVNRFDIRLTKDLGGTCREQLKTAEPTLDKPTLFDLLRLRLHAINLDGGITALSIYIFPAPLPSSQLSLYQDFAKTENNLLAANRALARIRAEFGPERVLQAHCLPSHLPEESFEWKLFDQIRKPSPEQQPNCLVRRILDTPKKISTPRRARLRRVFGPYTTSGYWWRKSEVHQSDYFVETQDGCTQWIFYDNIRRQWYERGFVQ